MNKQNVQILIDHLKTQTHCGFNMGVYVTHPHEPLHDHSPNHCGTTACLAGHIYHIVHNMDLTDEDTMGLESEMFNVGKHFLDLSGYQAGNLFLGLNSPTDLEDITLEQAIKVLEHLKATGEVDWSIVI